MWHRYFTGWIAKGKSDVTPKD